MIHLEWDNPKVIKQIKCVQAEARKFKVDTMLTPGKIYDVVNESDEFIFIIDNSDRVAGYLKEYFKAV